MYFNNKLLVLLGRKTQNLQHVKTNFKKLRNCVIYLNGTMHLILFY